jgi:hypothetical protein
MRVSRKVQATVGHAHLRLSAAAVADVSMPAPAGGARQAVGSRADSLAATCMGAVVVHRARLVDLERLQARVGGV